MAGYCSVTLHQAPAHKCLCRRDQNHNSPHRCYCGHLWGDPFVEMSYDEQRAFLWLPRVELVAGGRAAVYPRWSGKDSGSVRETFGRPDWRSHVPQPVPKARPSRDPAADLSKEIVIAVDGLSIGGRRLPGGVEKDSLHVEPICDAPGLWRVDLSLIATTPPRFIGTRLVEADGCEVKLRSGRWECVLDHGYHRDADLIDRLNGFKIGRT